MKLTFKLSFFALLLVSLFTITSCEDNLETSCDDFSANISYELVDSSFVTLTANPEGGEAPISYAWSTGAATQSIDITDEGVYSVTLTDATDCTASLDFTVEDTTAVDPCFGLSVNIIPDSSMVGDFELTAQVSGGTAPYSYLWSTNETTQSILSEGPGTYTVTVSDGMNCQFVDSYTYIADSTGCDNFNGVIDIEYNPGGGATLVTQISGGTPGYTYEWSTGETTEDITVSSSGIFSVVVTDSEGCTFYMITTVLENVCDGFSIELFTLQDSINNDLILFTYSSDGSTITEYLWSTGEITSEIVATPPGTYSLTVVNEYGCEAEDDITL